MEKYQMHQLAAFRCKSCGHLHRAEHAGENSVPHACSVCGAGVEFSPKGIKSLKSDNWEVLASCTPERLAELGLSRQQCSKHVPHEKGADQTGRSPQYLDRTTSEGTKLADQTDG